MGGSLYKCIHRYRVDYFNTSQQKYHQHVITKMRIWDLLTDLNAAFYHHHWPKGPTAYFCPLLLMSLICSSTRQSRFSMKRTVWVRVSILRFMSLSWRTTSPKKLSAGFSAGVQSCTGRLSGRSARTLGCWLERSAPLATFSADWPARWLGRMFS